MFKYAVYPSVGVTLVGWVVDGKQIPVASPRYCATGTKLTIGFGHKTENVLAILRTEVEGNVVSSTQKAVLEEEPKPPEQPSDNHDALAEVLQEAAIMNSEPPEEPEEP